MILAPLSDPKLSEINSEPIYSKEEIEFYKKIYKKIEELIEFYFDKHTLTPFNEILKKLEITEQTYILVVRSELKETEIYLKRTCAEVAINAYNIDLLNILQSNMDIQCITSPYRCISYITDYVCKLDTGLTKSLSRSRKIRQHH